MNLAASFLRIALIVLLSAFASFGAQAHSECRNPGKNSSLAMDQRDEQRMKCLKLKLGVLSVSQCLAAAKAMEFSNNAEDARLLCLYDLKKQPTLKECFTISKAMEYPDSGDEARWECIRRFNRAITIKQCLALSKSMSYPGNTERAKAYCENELP